MSYQPDPNPARTGTYPPGAAGSGGGGGPSGPRAGFGRRLVALLIDGILLSIVAGVIGEALGYDVFRKTSTDAGGAFYSATFNGEAFAVRFALELVYTALLEGSRAGQTIGKKVMGIRVMRMQTGEPLGIARAAGRYLAKYLSALPLFLGFLWAAWDREHQTWHDKIVGSVVVPTSFYPVDRP